MGHDIVLVVLGVVMALPIGIVIGSKYERSAAEKQRLYLRRVTNARKTVARPGTTVSTVRTASLSRPAPVKKGNATPRN